MELINTLSITGVAGSICSALNVPAPKNAEAPFKAVQQLCEGKNVDRVLIYNPDAVALWLYQKYNEMFLPVQKHVSVTLPIHAVMPSVTPVCFGSMYTGAMPAVHGIQKYEKPVITIDTIFDALLRAGKRPAIVSTAKDSLSCIFLEREMDYYIYPTVDEVNAKALELVEEDKYDFILVYNGNYDSTMHRNGPEAEASLGALQANAAMFDKLAEAVKRCWKNHTTLIGFCPDHGCHEIDGDLGSHGLEMPEDMNIPHFYGII